MSYCVNPSCPDPGIQRVPNPDQARFCSNCGAKLLLSDRYRAITLIGQGTVGRTFVGVDEHKPSRSRCIIKQIILPPQSADDAKVSTDLFNEEAIRLEQLGKHPQIPALLAHFEHARRQYLIQEFIEGDTLYDLVKRYGVFTEEQIRRLLNDILPVLQFVHIHQIIHRDIKPQNLIYRHTPPDSDPDGDSESDIAERTLYLVDFGAAKFATVSNFLMDGTQLGSQDYAAPEQIRGRATFSSDLYSLGVTCLYLLTHRSPMRMFNTDRNAWDWRSHLKQPISDRLTGVLDKLVARSAGERYKAANEVMDDLNQSVSRVSDRPTFIPKAGQKGQRSASAQAEEQSTWRCIHTLNRHQAWVRSIAFSPDGQWVVSGSGDKTVKRWSADSGELLHDLVGHTTWVRAVAISPDQQTIASVSNDKTVRLWSARTGQERHVLTGHSDWVRAAIFTPGGNTLITAAQDKAIHLWNVKQARLAHQLTGHQHWVLSLAITPNGKLLASGSRDRTIRIWNLVTQQCIRTLTGHAAEVSALAMSADGSILVSGSADQTIKFWDLASGKLLYHWTAHDSAINSVAISPDGRLLATASSDKTIKLWLFGSDQLLEVLTGHLGWVWAVAFPARSADTQPLRLASGSWDGTIKIWERGSAG